MDEIKVDLGERSYPIYIKSGAINDSSFFVPHIKGTKVVVITNTTLEPLFSDKKNIFCKDKPEWSSKNKNESFFDEFPV
mgnify:CR=1 FL=1